MEFCWNFICEFQLIRSKSKNPCTFPGTYPPVFMVVKLLSAICTPTIQGDQACAWKLRQCSNVFSRRYKEK